MTNYKILLVDDEQDILEFVSYNLRREGFEVYTACDGAQAIKVAREHKPHLVLLDVMMPQMDGIETCGELRKIPGAENMIIAFLTARAEDYSQIAGFDAGADDYIPKPIRPKVLISRLRALLKRYEATVSHQSGGSVSTGGHNSESVLVIDRERYLVVLEGREIALPRKEFELLALLYSKPEKVFSRDEIFDSVWGENVIVGDRTIDVHIRKLREKIGENYIVTVKGVGYKFSERDV